MNPAPRVDSGAAPTRRYPPRYQGGGPYDGARAYTNRPPDTYRGYGGSRYGYAVPRGSVPPRGPVAGPHGPYYYSNYYRGYRYPHYYYGGYRYRPYYGSWYRPYYYYPSPWYSFRPYVSIGFGVWLGYPVAFPAYGYQPYYTYPGSYVGVTRGYSNYGAVSFEITPGDAELFVDGNYVGRVGDFTPNYPPLTLSAGRHQVEVQAPGYETLVFDVDVLPGQVLPYRGALRPF